MTATSPLNQVYRSLLVQARKFPQYNYREFALRKIKHDFELTKALKDPVEIQKSLEEAKESLEQMKRMVKVQTLFVNTTGTDKLVIEENTDTKPAE